MIEAVGVTSITPNQGKKTMENFQFSSAHNIILKATSPPQITIIIWDWHELIDIIKYSCGYLPVNSLHDLDVFLSKIQLRNGRILH